MGKNLRPFSWKYNVYEEWFQFGYPGFYQYQWFNMWFGKRDANPDDMTDDPEELIMS